MTARIFENIEKAILEESINSGQCFVCGEAPSTGSGEHVMPKWLLNQLSMWNSRITLLNGTKVQYGKLTIPCCEECNNGFLATLESDVQKIFAAGKIKNSNDVLAVGRWLAKLLVGILTKETKLKLDRRDGSKGSIVDARVLEDFHLCHLILQSARKNASFDCLHSDYPFSLYWYDVEASPDDDPFDLITDPIGNAVALRINRLGVVFVGDGGLQMQVGKKGPFALSGTTVKMAAFRELIVRIFFKSQLRDATHFYINNETQEGIKIQQVRVSPYTGLVPGTLETQIFRPWNEEHAVAVIKNLIDESGNWRTSGE